MTSDRTPEYLAGLVRELCKLPRETEWLEFKTTIDKMAPGILAEIVRCLLPSFTLSDEEIMQKVVDLSSFIYNSRDIKNCLGIYLIDSMSSGFTDKNKYGEIDRSVKAWIGSLLR